MLQGNFDDLVGYEEDCGPNTVAELGAVQPDVLTTPAE
jgi:hypothetical protein